MRSLLADARRLAASEGPGGVMVRGGLGSFAAAAVAAGLGLVAQAVVSRVLGPGEFGQYIYTTTWVSVVSIACALGLDTSALRFVASHRALGEWGHLRGFLGLARAVPLAAALTVSMVAVFVSIRLGPRVRDLVAAAALLLPLLVALRMEAAFLQGLKHPVLSQVVQGLTRPSLIAMVLLLLTTGFTAAPVARVALQANAGVTLAALAAAVVLVRRSTPGLGGVLREWESSLWLTTSLPLLLISSAQTILTSTDTLMIGGMLGTTDAGVYAVASQLGTVVGFGMTAVNSIMAPLIAELYADQRRAELQRVLTLSARVTLAYALAVAVALLILGGLLLDLYGPGFDRGRIPLLVLCGGHVVGAACGSVGFLLTMTGHERLASGSILTAALLNLALNALLIPALGMSGAALATAISVGFRGLLLTVWAGRRLGLDASVLGKLR